jgi:peptidoglycan glycosyltransferase
VRWSRCGGNAGAATLLDYRLSPSTPQATRRRRIITRALPVAALGAIAFVIGAVIGSTSPALDAVERFASAWSREDYPAMHAELTEDAAERYPLEDLERAYSDAHQTVTVETISPGDPDGPESVSGEEVVTVPVTVATHAFGTVNGELAVPVDGDEIAWEPRLVFPGLEAGERLDRRVRTPKRAPILARDGTPLAEGPAAARTSPLGAAATNVAGSMGVPKRPQAEELAGLGFPETALTGTSGLEQAFNLRLAGRPGGDLLAVPADGSAQGEPRVLASTEPMPGEPVHTTIDPTLQEAAVTALGGTFGGVAVLDADDGSVRALAGVAFSAPQPPGSTFKVITTVAALEADAVRLDETFPVETSNTDIGREISNANDEACGGTFVESFAHSCNTVFAPLGVEIGGERLVRTAERFGFNETPTLFNAQASEIIKPPASTIPEELPTNVEVGVSAIGQGEVLSTPLEMASVSQTIAAGGLRSPTPIVTDPGLGPDAEPVRVTDERTAATVRDLMIEVVRSGTGVPAALPGVEVAGKTGTAELGPKPNAPPPAEGEEPEQELDAWFTAFAPARSPEIAVAVMVVNAEGGGGDVAGPIAREVFGSEFG